MFGKNRVVFSSKNLERSYQPIGPSGRPTRPTLTILSAYHKATKAYSKWPNACWEMWRDPRLKKIYDKEADKPPKASLRERPRFSSKIGPERRSRIVDQAVELLVKKGRIKCQVLALDLTFIKSGSRRNLDNNTGYNDPESRIGKTVESEDWGYRLHLAIDEKS